MSSLVYFASPMCSWCWGFSPVIEKLKQVHPSRQIRLVLTPFRVDTTEPMDKKLRDYVLGQWHKVHAATSQPFDFNFSVPNNFIYNTMQVGLAIKAFKQQREDEMLNFVKKVQYAFYADNKNITDAEVLSCLAEEFSIDIEDFKHAMFSQQINAELQQDFELCKILSVQSYPTLMHEKNDEYLVLAEGYLPYAELKPRIEKL